MYERYFNRPLAEVDPLIAELIGYEEERQARKIILIPSEALAPAPVREALGSVFTNLYAEGYPPVRMVRSNVKILSDMAHQLAYLRRYADRRFYKGVEYVDLLEALVQRRVAECFANPRARADEIFVNIQPLSGAAANLAVYEAFLQPGDVVMGMDLMHGGHLTHGSRFNFSGKRYKVVSYTVDPKTELLDYDQILDLAKEHKPKLIIAGYTSYPWAPDWERFREIADSVGAILLADIAHTAGMAIAGVYPNPVGIADVVTFTTHKTICGPRGACILTTEEAKAERIDNSVFPGEQGGPHVNKFAAMAVAFGIAQTEAFRELQHRIVDNARSLAEALQKRGVRLAYGGTDTHIVMIDLKSVHPELRGEPAARILDLAGIVVNRNTIPGDTITALGTGIRLGTPWVSQRGMGEKEMEKIGELIHRIISNIRPFSYQGLRGELPRGKIEFEILEGVKREVEELTGATAAETRPRGIGYPHYYFLREPRLRALAPVSARAGSGSDSESEPESGNPRSQAQSQAQSQSQARERAGAGADLDLDRRTVLQVRGERALPLLQEALTADIASLRPGGCTPSFILERDGQVMADLLVLRLEPERFILFCQPENAPRVLAWLRGLSDGYIIFDDEDLLRKVQGPAVIEDLATDLPEEERLALLRRVEEALEKSGLDDDRLKGLRISYDGGRPHVAEIYERHRDLFRLTKPYFVGQKHLERFAPSVEKEEFRWEGPGEGPLRRTPLFAEHKRLGARFVPFAGWEMPVWYSSAGEEHRAVREAAGLFDLGHMGVLEVSGEHATSLLDLATTNYVRWLKPGESQYTYLLDPDGRVIDDLIVYCRTRERYLLVVNAVNAEKDLAWLQAVNSGEYLLDRRRPWIEPEGPAQIRDLKAPEAGEDRRIDLALQGPKSLSILKSLARPELAHRLGRLKRTAFLEDELAGIPVMIARTGYTGEEFGYELLLHPDRAGELWQLLLEVGAEFGLKPAGLGARDSTRTEAGLPLYGHELGGELEISPIEAGFEGYVKFHKPFFIGREALLHRKREMKMTVVRFRMERKGVRLPKYGDPVVDRNGRFLGRVTSCALDTAGFLVGMAYIERGASSEGTPLWIYSLPEREEKGLRGLGPGDRVPLPNEAKVIPRFHISRPIALHAACQE